jgi:hypothetical protein
VIPLIITRQSTKTAKFAEENKLSTIPSPSRVLLPRKFVQNRNFSGALKNKQSLLSGKFNEKRENFSAQ